jgi:hypothetical protein
MSTNPNFLQRIWPRLLDVLVTVVVALVAYRVSCWLVPPETVARGGFGLQWEKVSADPFGFPGELPQRFLAPLLAWSLGFRGAPHWVEFTGWLGILFLGTVHFFCRRRGASAVDAALITLAVAVVSPVQIYKQNWVGYSDDLTYALCFWMLLAAPRPALFWGLYFCNLMNHELAAFLLPWAWFVRREQDARWRVDALGAALAVGAYAAFYFYVKTVAPDQLFTNDYFASNPLFPGGAFVVWCLVATHWVLAFGPVLAVVAWHQHLRPRDPERRHLWWVLLGVFVIFCIAYDWSRHCNLVVIPLVLGSIAFLRAGHRFAFLALVVLGAVLMQVWSPWPVGSWPTKELIEPEPVFLAKAGVIVPVTLPDGSTGIGFGPLSAALGTWLPRVWPALTLFLALLAAIWTAGFAMARRDARAARP